MEEGLDVVPWDSTREVYGSANRWRFDSAADSGSSSSDVSAVVIAHTVVSERTRRFVRRIIQKLLGNQAEVLELLRRGICSEVVEPPFIYCKK